VVKATAKFVDSLERAWDRRGVRRVRSASLVLVLAGGVALIEAGRWLWPESGPLWLPKVHLAAISWSISLLLLFELVETAFTISKSVASSVARLLQLFALVLLRDAFSKLAVFPEPIVVRVEDLSTIAIMASDAAGGIVLIVAAAVFTRLQRHTPITADVGGGELFGAIKRIVVILLLGVLVGLCVLRIGGLMGVAGVYPAIDTYLTILVFVDVLLAFISLAFTTNPAIVFRNFGFAFAAILLRLAVASPELVRPVLAVAGALTALAITIAYNLSMDESGNPGKPGEPLRVADPKPAANPTQVA
jgi:hypothetical protein